MLVDSNPCVLGPNFVQRVGRFLLLGERSAV
jgi:hypothetical protein